MNSQVYKELEAGAVHADLFRNNSLIEINGDEQNLGGVIDFTSPAMLRFYTTSPLPLMTGR